MTISEYIRKYGTHTTAAILRRYANELANASMLREMANDLQSALETYATDVEPPDHGPI